MKNSVYPGRLRRTIRRGMRTMLLVQAAAAVLLAITFYGVMAAFAAARVFPYIQAMEVTAYTAGPESTGKDKYHPEYGVTASTHRLQVGAGEKCIAAPPEISFGTRIVVPGYGVAVVKDRGGDIVGDRLDVYFDQLDVAQEWGRRNLKVLIIP